MTWIVTGASRGLGRHLVRQMSAKGWHVVAVARDAAGLDALAQSCGRDLVTPWPMDLSDAAQVMPRMMALLAHLGAEATIEGVIHNAGIGQYRALLDHHVDESMAILQVNLGAVVQITHALLPRMLAQGHGQVIAIGSDLARRPLGNMAVYAASKHGLAGFAHSLLREVKDRGIRVSLINPGIIDTDFGGTSEGSRGPSWSLAPADLAALILRVMQQPARMVVDELSVHPLQQDNY